MEHTAVRIKLLREGAQAPAYGSGLAAGADLRACLESDVVIAPGETAFIPTGIAIELPEGYAGLVCARSGLASKEGLAPANKVGVIDADYRGEITTALHNHGSVPRTVTNGQRIAQLLVVPVLTPAFEVCSELDDTERGSGGFGSTGKL